MTTTTDVLDKDLHDDMLKLVRYKVLFVRREYEVAFPEQEDLVSDNMDGSAFTAWKVAEFIQDLGKKATPVPTKWGDKNYPPEEFVEGQFLNGIPHEDKKYLRVYYEVLDRYPREKFKYEEQQIRILEQIRDSLQLPGRRGGGSAPGPSGNPFDDIAQRLEANTPRLKKLRQGFQSCAEKFGSEVAKAYEQYREVGEFTAITVTQKQLQAVFRHGLKATFDASGLDSFPGKWEGTNRVYDFKTGQEIKPVEPAWKMVWEPGVTKNEQYVQRVVGSQTKHYLSSALPSPPEKVDLALNVHRKDIGLTGWLSTSVQFRSEMALISYEFEPGKFLWIGQVLAPDTLQPPPGREKRFWMFLEWITIAENKRNYYMYGLQFDIDFDECQLKVFDGQEPGPPNGVRKTRFDYVAKLADGGAEAAAP
jgi:hypothetical protein